MKSIQLYLVLVFSALLSSLLTACSFGQSEEDVILSRLEELRDKAAISRKLNKLELLAQSKEIVEYFCPVFDFEPPEDYEYSELKSYSKDKIRQGFLKMKSYLGDLELSISQEEIVINGKNASVELTGSALGSASGDDGQFFEHHRGQLELEKIEGEWRICRAIHLENLRE